MTTAVRAGRSAVLSVRGRELLEERLRELEQRTAKLELELTTWPDDPHTGAALMAARNEASEVRNALVLDVAADDGDHDPDTVEVGDTVALRRLRGRTVERFVIVHEREARHHDSWISARSPLGAAVLDSHVGDVVAVRTPSGVVSYEIRSIEREA